MTAGTLPRELAKIVCDILQAEMDLDDAHCLLGDQKWDIPADKKLFVAVYDQNVGVFGAANFLDADPASATVNSEIQQSVALHDVRVELMSFDSEARVRKEEAGLALASIFAQQQAERYGLQIGRAAAAVDASETEVTARLLKYVVHVNITTLHQKVKAPPAPGFYDKFNRAVEDGSAKTPEVSTQ